MARDELPPLPESSFQFERVVTSVLSIDIAEEFENLEPQILIKDALSPQAIAVALNKADSNALRAHRVYTAAKVEYEQKKLDLDKIEASMREQAISELSAEKDIGAHRKAITEADVKVRMSTMFPDQFEALHTSKIRAEAVLAHLERFAELFQSRCYALKSLNGR